MKVVFQAPATVAPESTKSADNIAGSVVSGFGHPVCAARYWQRMGEQIPYAVFDLSIVGVLFDLHLDTFLLYLAVSEASA